MIATWVFENKVSEKLLLQRLNLSFTYFVEKEIEMLDAYGGIERQKSTTTFMRKSLRRIWISCSTCSASKTLRVLKKLGKKQKISNAKKVVNKIIAFIA